ncbi:hypothetical protein [uncultured Ferrimonas sp.]|uniref:hypothetical protein n=1 Tax=uncultured Ferrimonas sp. TaxID=432640 RepID=UPI0026020E4D|nr:hypothetical protein [uncultured Ferrimonas sp.]
MSSSSAASKRTLLLLLGLFSLPVIAAALVLKLGWYQGGSTNHGQLLSDLSYQQLRVANPAEQTWQIVTFVPNQCDHACQQHLQQLNQAHIALGREHTRVIPIAYSSEAITAPERFRQVINPPLQQALAPYAMVVVDPWGQWVLGYQQGQSRDMLLDLRKLLKLSRIG